MNKENNHDNIVDLAARRAKDDPGLRGMTPRIKLHYERIKQSMDEKQTLWGGDLSILDENTRMLSAALRRTLAFEYLTEHMPVHVEPYALLAGSCMQDGRIVRCMLPSFILEEELGQCTMSISHKCPDYETLLRDGFTGILEKLERR